jgi:hypothetical protein
MKNDILKTLAMKAKNRMINKNLRNTYVNSSIKIIDNSDQEFYDKVKEIIIEDEDILNPLKRLMDENRLMKLDARGKERYLLETIEKYQQAKRLIENEKYKII